MADVDSDYLRIQDDNRKREIWEPKVNTQQEQHERSKP